MRTNMTQLIVLALAILFAMALALTVSLICLSFAREATGTSEITDVNLPKESETILPPTPNDPLPLPPAEGRLAYSSNGNGTCTLTGIGTYTDTTVIIPCKSPAGDLVTSIAARAFYGCASINTVQIPSTVTSIGALAFADCPNLLDLSVDSANYAYCDIDGVLYTSDGGTLLLYPPRRVGSSMTISVVTTNIADMAFYHCEYLTHVYYSGSAEQWESICIGSKNYALTAASKTFYGSGQP